MPPASMALTLPTPALHPMVANAASAHPGWSWPHRSRSRLCCSRRPCHRPQTQRHQRQRRHEGAIFSALLRGKTPDPEAFRDNDQRILSIDGVTVAVEAPRHHSPRSSLGNFAENPSFSLEGRWDEPFGLPFLGNTGAASPTIADVDGDGDLDLFIGTRWGNTYFFRNIAVAGATDPAFNAGNKRNWIVPSGIERVQSPNLELFPDRNANPILADIDDDGDFDLFIGNRYGYIHFFRNTGSASTHLHTRRQSLWYSAT